jgi:uncharacterized protein with HEPN domain
MLEAAKKAVQLAKGSSRADLESNEMLTLALTRLLEIIGEAARAVTEGTRQRGSTIAWKQICGTRDRLIHGYFDVDLNVIWAILTNDLPLLIVSLERLLADQPDSR